MQHSTGYIIGFAAAVCLVCSVFVASSAVLLKDRQEANVLLDRQSKVLIVAGLMQEGQRLPAEEIGRLFTESIKPRVVEIASGSYADAEVDANSYDQRKAATDPARSSAAPDNRARVMRVPNYGLVYLVQRPGEEVEAIILPVEGKGLWSTLYGYIALAPDTRTIKGITFYQHGETAGLGGEVDNPRWKALWPGRLAFDERWTPRIAVKKGAAGSVADDPYNVDGLAGATLTSRGVTNLLRFWLGDDAFGPYLAGIRSSGTI
jgi:Na+-transporting NADH:ubiquinone oxidoreductase subunit C